MFVAGIRLRNLVPLHVVDGLVVLTDTTNIVLDEAHLSVEDVHLPVVREAPFMEKEFLRHDAAWLNVCCRPLQLDGEGFLKATSQVSLNPPFRPRNAVLIPAVSDDAIAAFRPCEWTERALDIGERFRSVVHDEKRFTRPVIGFDHASLRQGRPGDRCCLCAPVIQTSQPANLFFLHHGA